MHVLYDRTIFVILRSPKSRRIQRRRGAGAPGPMAALVITALDIGGVGNVAGGALYTGLHLSVFLSFAFDAQAEDNRRARMSRARMFSFTQCHKSSAYAFLIIIGKVHTLN
jgi:hypothetical protein